VLGGQEHVPVQPLEGELAEMVEAGLAQQGQADAAGEPAGDRLGVVGDWERLPDRFGVSPGEVAEERELIAAVQRAVEEDLTDRQRKVFTALVVDGIPLDALVVRLGSSRKRSIRRCSTPGVSCGPFLQLTGI
jgi:hypothetical protein